MKPPDDCAEISTLIKHINACEVGSSLGGEYDIHYVNYVFIVLAVASVGIGVFFFAKQLLRKRNLGSFVTKTITLSLSGIAAMITFFGGFALRIYYGGPYAYHNYSVPDKASHIVFWFTGVNEGGFCKSAMNTSCSQAYFQFGEKHVALYNFSDIDKALKLAEQISNNTKILVRGHSRGGVTAYQFAQRLNKEILILDTRDPVGWFDKPKGKPSNVIYWRNVLPGDTDFSTSRDIHWQTNYVGNINVANVARCLGGAWGKCDGAINIVLQGMDHQEVGFNLIEDQ